MLLDEAHRARTYRDAASGKFPLTLGKLIDRAAVTVLFLDERHIIRPSEGITLAEVRNHAAQRDIPLIHIDLTTQFRCNGSVTYRRWIDDLLEPGGMASPWNGTDYDLAVADDPDEFSQWVQRHADNGGTARITAGFCWPWKSPPNPPLLPEVEIAWTGPNGVATWARPWNARQEDSEDPDVPARHFWSTDPGGENQVGCIYTAQGMEYAYNVVIFGDDLVRRGDSWIAQPHVSHDREELSNLPPRSLPALRVEHLPRPGDPRYKGHASLLHRPRDPEIFQNTASSIATGCSGRCASGVRPRFGSKAQRGTRTGGNNPTTSVKDA